MNDTIAAISTTLGVGAIAIVRVSGKDAIPLVNKIFSGKDLEKVDTHTINYGYIKKENEKIDEVYLKSILTFKLLSYFFNNFLDKLILKQSKYKKFCHNFPRSSSK